MHPISLFFLSQEYSQIQSLMGSRFCRYIIPLNLFSLSPVLIFLSLVSQSLFFTKSLIKTERRRKRLLTSKPCLYNTMLLTLFKVTTCSVLKQQFLLLVLLSLLMSLRSQVRDLLSSVSICLIKHTRSRKQSLSLTCFAMSVNEILLWV